MTIPKNPTLSDKSHLDPCRFCRGSHLRAEMHPARTVLGDGKRGYVCDGCYQRRRRLGIL